MALQQSCILMLTTTDLRCSFLGACCFQWVSDVFPLALLHRCIFTALTCPCHRLQRMPRGLWAPHLVPVVLPLPRPKVTMKPGLFQSFSLSSLSEKGFP